MKNILINNYKPAKESKDESLKSFYLEVNHQYNLMVKELQAINYSELTQAEKLIWNILTDNSEHPLKEF